MGDYNQLDVKESTVALRESPRVAFACSPPCPSSPFPFPFPSLRILSPYETPALATARVLARQAQRALPPSPSPLSLRPSVPLAPSLTPPPPPTPLQIGSSTTTGSSNSAPASAPSGPPPAGRTPSATASIGECRSRMGSKSLRRGGRRGRGRRLLVGMFREGGRGLYLGVCGLTAERVVWAGGCLGRWVRARAGGKRQGTGRPGGACCEGSEARAVSSGTGARRPFVVREIVGRPT